MTHEELIALAASMTADRAKALQERTAKLQELITDDTPLADDLRVRILEITNRLDGVLEELASPTLTATQGLQLTLWLAEGNYLLDTIVEPILRLMHESRS